MKSTRTLFGCNGTSARTSTSNNGVMGWVLQTYVYAFMYMHFMCNDIETCICIHICLLTHLYAYIYVYICIYNQYVYMCIVTPAVSLCWRVMRGIERLEHRPSKGGRTASVSSAVFAGEGQRAGAVSEKSGEMEKKKGQWRSGSVARMTLTLRQCDTYDIDA